MADVTEYLAARADFINAHLKMYLESDGAQGHVVDLTQHGAGPAMTHLVLKTIGRRSGRPSLVPLIYDKLGEEFIIVASKGGADVNPAWYLNLGEKPTVDFQVGSQKYRGSWRIIEGIERGPIWEQLANFYPPYREYQLLTTRVIPMIALKPIEAIASLQ